MEDCIYVFSVAFSGKFDGFSRFFQFFPVFSRFFSDEKFLKKIAKFSRKPVIFLENQRVSVHFSSKPAKTPFFPFCEVAERYASQDENFAKNGRLYNFFKENPT